MISVVPVRSGLPRPLNETLVVLTLTAKSAEPLIRLNRLIPASEPPMANSAPVKAIARVTAGESSDPGSIAAPKVAVPGGSRSWVEVQRRGGQRRRAVDVGAARLVDPDGQVGDRGREAAAQAQADRQAGGSSTATQYRESLPTAGGRLDRHDPDIAAGDRQAEPADADGQVELAEDDLNQRIARQGPRGRCRESDVGR